MTDAGDVRKKILDMFEETSRGRREERRRLMPRQRATRKQEGMHFETTNFLREMRDSFQDQEGVDALTLYNAQAILYELPTRLGWELRLGYMRDPALVELEGMARNGRDPGDIRLELRDIVTGKAIADLRMHAEPDGRGGTQYACRNGPTLDGNPLTFAQDRNDPSRSRWRAVIHAWLLVRMEKRLEQLML